MKSAIPGGMTLREFYGAILDEPISDEFAALLNKLDQLPEEAVCVRPTSYDPSTNATGATPNGQPTN